MFGRQPFSHTAVQHTLRRLLKWLGFIALGCYVLLAIAFLGVRYWVLPNIDQWREPLERQLSARLPVQVQLGEVKAQWHRRNPEISLRDVDLRDDAGRLLLKLPSLNVVFDWSSLLWAQPRFTVLQADGVELTLRRDTQNRISIVGYELGNGEDSTADDRGDTGLIHWLAQQGNVRLTHARILWLDERRQAPPLELRDVTLGIAQRDDEHLVSLVAEPPTGMGQSLKLQVRMKSDFQAGRPFSLADLSGLVHVDVADMRPAGWQPWLDVHGALEQGRVSWRAWQEVVRGVAQQHVSLVSVEDGRWNPTQGLGLNAEKAEFYLAGNWDSLMTLLSREGMLDHGAAGPTAVRIALQMRGLTLEHEAQLEEALQFEAVAFNADVGRDPDAALYFSVDQAQVRNADMDLQFSGGWREDDEAKAGRVDIQGQFKRAELSAIVRYLPAMVDDDAKQWMRDGLLAGRLINAPLRLQGDLTKFPFGDEPALGDFFVGGEVEGAVIDYAPASAIDPPGWPRLESLDGYAQLHRVALSIRADTMQMQPGGGTIALREVDALIPNIEQGSVLQVKGVGEGSAAAFISLLRESPLDALLDGMFKQSKGEGQWQVPISLTIPLTDTSATEVQGEVVFEKARLHLDPRYPELTDLKGRLSFSDAHVTANGLTGRSLGGPVKISGGIGSDQKGMVFQGTFTTKALNTYLDGALEGVANGKAPYRLVLQRGSSGAMGVEFESNLENVALSLPPPFNKASGQTWPLQAVWTPARASGESAVLSVKLAKLLNLKLLHRRSENEGRPFFHAGSLGVRAEPETPAEGLVMDIRSPSIDIDAWRDLGKSMGGTSEGGVAPATLFPRLRDLRIQADKARLLDVDLDQLTFTARQPQGERWRVDISSTQTAGTLFWKESRGRIEGEVEANFQRLALGDPEQRKNGDSSDEALSHHLDEELNFPALRLKVDNLRLYGRDVGALSVVGLNDAQEHRWKLEQLELTSPHGSLKGSGLWQLKGSRRGLKLDAQALIDGLGAYLEQAGFEGLVEGGHGQIDGVVEWRDLPWDFGFAGLHGELRVDLAKGRFAHVGSRSARLLELLSLQSVQRLASFNWNPGGLLKEGFPFDALQGHIKVENGNLHSENYRVTGPVATIVIAGDVNLPQETLDLYAVLVPNLDVSGAAIAAGIAVNPIVGVGAFLTQWLLKHPMSKAMTVEYRVRGDLDSPEIEELDTQKEKGTLPGHPVSGSDRGQ